MIADTRAVRHNRNGLTLERREELEISVTHDGESVWLKIGYDHPGVRLSWSDAQHLAKLLQRGGELAYLHIGGAR